MALATVSAANFGIPWPTGYGTFGTLKIICDRTFVFGGKPYVRGRVGDPINQNWCVQSAITVVGGIGTFASFILPQTDTAITVTNGSGTPLYTGIIFDAHGTKRQILFEGWRLDQALGLTTNYETWAISNSSVSVINPRTDFLGTDAVNNLITARLYAPATTTQLGLVKMSTTPVDAANPIAVSDNDPRITTGAQGAVNILSYGADPNGSVSSRAAMVSAYNAAVATGARRLYMPAGIYLLTVADFAFTGHQLYITDANVEWFGDGMGKTIIKIQDGITPANDPVILYTSGDRANVHDFTIQGTSNTLGTDSPTGVALRNSKGSWIHRVQVVNLNNNIAAGGGAAGAAAFSYDSAGAVSYDELSTTTLGTTILAGTRTVTPASMLNIATGRRLKIGGTAEYVVISSVTQTTFTAVFANAHNSTDIVTALGEGQDAATFEECEIRDALNCSAFVVNAQGGRFVRNRMINGGNNPNNGCHAFYVQQGGNVFESNYIEYFGLPSIQEYPGGTGDREVTANRWIGNDVIGTRHFFTGGTPQINDGGVIVSVPVNTSLQRQQVLIGNHFRSPWGGPISGSLELGPRVIFANNYVENGFIQQSNGDATTEAIITGNTFLGVGIVQTPWAILARDNSIVADNQIIDFNSTNNIGTEAPISVGNYCDVHNNRIIRGNYFYAIYAAGTTATKIHDNIITGAAAGTILAPKALGIRQGIGLEVYNNFIDGNGVIAVLDDFSNGGSSPGTIKFYGNTLKNFALDSGRIILHGSVTTWGAGLDFYNNDISQLAVLERNSKKLWPAGRNPAVDVNQNELVGINSSNRLLNITTGDTVFFGIYAGPQQAMGVANDDVMQLAVYEIGAEFTVKADAAWTRSHVGIVSVTTAGKIHDNGTTVPPAAPASYLVFLDSGGAAGLAKVRLMRTL